MKKTKCVSVYLCIKQTFQQQIEVEKKIKILFSRPKSNNTITATTSAVKRKDILSVDQK